MINPFSKLDMVKYAGKTVAINPKNGDIVASAKERRSLKYDKTKYKNVYILTLPFVEKSKQITRVALVLDESGSMIGIKNKAIKVFKGIMYSVREGSLNNNQESTISVYTFNYNTSCRYFDKSAKNAHVLSKVDYNPGGSTALFDSIEEALTRFKNLNDDENVSYLIYVITDGKENNSKRVDKIALQKLFKECNVDGRYSIVLMTPPGYAKIFCQTYSIPTDNVREWEATKKGIQDVGTITNQAMSNYYSARSAGVRSVTNFFANVDLGKVQNKDLKKLTDISKYVKIFDVPKECVIKDFVEEKTKRPYIIGSAFYRLDKTELVQPQKEVIILNKDDKAVYSGYEARQLIGLPSNDSCKLNPYNLSKYEVYIKSTSVNRKLSRNTKLLLDKRVTNNQTPTWSI